MTLFFCSGTGGWVCKSHIIYFHLNLWHRINTNVNGTNLLVYSNFPFGWNGKSVPLVRRWSCKISLVHETLSHSQRTYIDVRGWCTVHISKIALFRDDKTHWNFNEYSSVIWKKRKNDKHGGKWGFHSDFYPYCQITKLLRYTL
jgi:hypothetical protein